MKLSSNWVILTLEFRNILHKIFVQFRHETRTLFIYDWHPKLSNSTILEEENEKRNSFMRENSMIFD